MITANNRFDASVLKSSYCILKPKKSLQIRFLLRKSKEELSEPDISALLQHLKYLRSIGSDSDITNSILTKLGLSSVQLF